MVNLSTKFEVSNYTDYEDMKGDGLGSLEIAPFDRRHTSSY